MILVRYTNTGSRRVIDLTDIYKDQAAMLVGGSPSLREQPIELLEQRGLITMAMNNAAQHFRPTLWASCDHPNCYQPRILMDPTITKFAAAAHAKHTIERLGDAPFSAMPNTYFYFGEKDIPWDEYLQRRKEVPWYNNTMMSAIHILYQMGIRTIVLAGSDFGYSKSGDMYAHNTEFGSFERKWNLDLYNSIAQEIRMLKPVFDEAGLKLYDSSKNSRLAQVYPHVTLEEGVDICLKQCPQDWVDSKDLPHCSKYAPDDIKKKIADWPGYNVLPDAGNTKDSLEVQQVM